MKILVCRECHHDAHMFTQPALLPGRKPAVQVECRTVGCPNYKMTTDRRDAVEIDRRFYLEDDPEEIDHELDRLQWRIQALARLTPASNEQRGLSQQDAAPLTNQTINKEYITHG